MTGARFRGMVAEAPTAPGLLVLTPGATFEGPTELGADDAREAGLGGKDVDLYALDSTDASGVALVYGWMSAAARRVGGGIVPADRSRLVTPDPGAAVDLTLWSPVPLAAQDALPLVRPAMSGARVGLPVESGGGGAVPDGDVRVRRGGRPCASSGLREIPVALSTLEPSEYGPWAYHVTWEPLDPDELRTETPSQLHLIARSRVQQSVARIAAVLWRGVGGTVVDRGGFVVPPGELQDMETAAR